MCVKTRQLAQILGSVFEAFSRWHGANKGVPGRARIGQNVSDVVVVVVVVDTLIPNFFAATF